MEEVLAIYERRFDPNLPVICMDEQPVQLKKDVRIPIPATREHPKRVDYEYERAGTCSIFLFTEPLGGWRYVRARPRRTKQDWAQEVASLLDDRYSHCAKVILVCDNLNTHTIGAFYEAFEPSKARRYAEKVQICHTPKHGSWLNIAENELSSLTRQCVQDRRFESIEILNRELTAWSHDVNSRQKGVDWQFTIDAARVKLKSLYPTILC
jgi:hypothetical protein